MTTEGRNKQRRRLWRFGCEGLLGFQQMARDDFTDQSCDFCVKPDRNETASPTYLYISVQSTYGSPGSLQEAEKSLKCLAEVFFFLLYFNPVGNGGLLENFDYRCGTLPFVSQKTHSEVRWMTAQWRQNQNSHVVSQGLLLLEYLVNLDENPVLWPVTVFMIPVRTVCSQCVCVCPPWQFLTFRAIYLLISNNTLNVELSFLVSFQQLSQYQVHPR